MSKSRTFSLEHSDNVVSEVGDLQTGCFTQLTQQTGDLSSVHGVLISGKPLQQTADDFWVVSELQRKTAFDVQ